MEEKRNTKNSNQKNYPHKPIVRIVCWTLALLMILGTVSGVLIYMIY